MDRTKHTVAALLVFIVLPGHVFLDYDGRSHKDCKERADVVFLLDGSDSISDAEFQKQKELVINFIRDSNIGQDAIRVGALVFSSDLGDSVALSHIQKDEIINAVWSMTQPQDGSRLDLGINQLEQMIYQNGRKGIPHIGIVITDGRDKYPDASKGESQAVRNIGIKLVTVGVGRLIDESALMKIASKPELYFPSGHMVETSFRLVRTVYDFGTEWCKELKQPVTTTTTTAATTTTTRRTTTPTTTTTTTTTKAPATIALAHHNQVYQVSENTYNINNPKENARDIKVVTIPTFETATSINNKNVPPSNSGSGSAPMLSTGHWMKSRPAEKPWWETQNGQDVKAAQELGWGVEEDKDNRKWQPKQTTTRAPTKPEPKTPWYHVTEKPWEGIYRNPVQSIKLFDIQIPLRVPHIIRNTRPNKPPPTTQFVPTTPKIVTTPQPTPPPPQPTTPPLPPPKNSQFTEPDLVPGRIEQGGTQTHVHAVSDKDRVCFGSQFVDGVGYNSDPKSCNEFVQCFYDNGKIRAENARCPFRMFWDQRLLLCRPSESMQCWRDPCFDFSVRSYDHKGNCRAHWSCENGLSTARCCPLGFAYRKGEGCVRDTTCKDWCEDSGELTFSAPFASCRMTPFETNEKFYFEEIPGLGMMTRSCPRGSRFNAGLCTCEISDDVRKKTCRPELIMDFTEGFYDKSGNNLAITPQNVHVENGAAKFEGNGKVTIWRFSSFSFGSQITITLKYKQNLYNRNRERQHLISNCCCMDQPGPSLDVSVYPDQRVQFTAATRKDGEVSTYVPTQSNEWKTATYIYDGSHLTGIVDGVNSTVRLQGVIEERPAALVLGSCDFFGGFDGYIDDVRLYLCVPGSVS